MSFVDFSKYKYYPALLSGFAEHEGYRRLSAQDKKSILPIFELSRTSRNSVNLDKAILNVKKSASALPFILDVSHEWAPPPYQSKKKISDPKKAKEAEERFHRELIIQKEYNLYLKKLLSPNDGFHNWRQIVATYENVIPVIQFNNPHAERKEILKQATVFSAQKRSTAIRISLSADPAICTVVAEIISQLQSPEQLLIVIDCGQKRIQIQQRADSAVSIIKKIVSLVSAPKQQYIRAACLSNSYTQPGHQGLREYKNLDRRLFARASQGFPFSYGDYGATFRIKARDTFMPPDWLACVVLPEKDQWILYRSENLNDRNGWIDGAKAISKHPSFKTAPRIWGVSLIDQAAKGNIEGIASTRFWNAAKTNVHLHQQINSV